MLICQLQLNDIYHFIQRQKAENRLATVCERDDAEFMTGGNNPIYFKFCTYSDDDIDLVYYELSSSGDVSYSIAGNPFQASTLSLTYTTIDFAQYTTLGYYTVYDIYGNEYETDATYLGRSDAV